MPYFNEKRSNSNFSFFSFSRCFVTFCSLSATKTTVSLIMQGASKSNDLYILQLKDKITQKVKQMLTINQLPKCKFKK